MQKSGESIASSTKIQSVGSYDRHLYIAEPPDCTVCHNAEYGDFLYNGICGKCLYAHFKNDPKVETDIILTPGHSKVFANWYVKGFFEDVLKMIEGMSISLEICDVDAKDFEGDEDTHWQQADGYFPEEGIVTIQQISVREDLSARWKIALEVEDLALWKHYGPDRFSFSPEVIDASWDPTFVKMMNGEAAEWGLR